jgi:hypothetical protein
MGTLQVPEVLKGKLVFGCEEQIASLRAYEQEQQRFFGDGTQKRYRVSVEIEFWETITVMAGSQAEAEKKARDDFSLSFNRHDFSFHAEEDETDA